MRYLDVMTELVHDEDFAWMQEALGEAERAGQQGEVPVGAVIVYNNQVVGRGHNLREGKEDPIAHAEILAIQDAASTLGRWRLSDCTLYVTLEPCPMCAGAIVNSRLTRLVYGAADLRAGAVRSVFQLCDDPRLNHRSDILGGLRKEECGRILSDFFAARRALKKRISKEPI